MGLKLPTFLFENKPKNEDLSFSFCHICLTLSKFLKCCSDKGSTESWAKLEAKVSISRKELPGFIKGYVFIYYIGFKKISIDTSPSVYASCWLSCFSFTLAVRLGCETDMCVSCSAQQEMQQKD